MRMKVGDYDGAIVRRFDGSWAVTVSPLVNRDRGDYRYGELVSAERIFEVSVLHQQLRAVGLFMTVRLWGSQCVLTPEDVGRRGSVASEGQRLQRLMKRHYGRFGSERHRVHWSWSVRQYD